VAAGSDQEELPVQEFVQGVFESRCALLAGRFVHHGNDRAFHLLRHRFEFWTPEQGEKGRRLDGRELGVVAFLEHGNAARQRGRD